MNRPAIRETYSDKAFREEINEFLEWQDRKEGGPQKREAEAKAKALADAEAEKAAHACSCRFCAMFAERDAKRLRGH